MKTKMNHLVAIAIFALLILGGNVSAKGTEIIASSHESIKEQALVIEDWMLNENNWENWLLMEANQNVAEETIELEYWMIDQNVWTIQVIQENESKLAMEDWMNNENNWTR